MHGRKGEKRFCPGPMVSFQSARKVSSYLVKAKLHFLQRIVSSFKYLCLNINETTDTLLVVVL